MEKIYFWKTSDKVNVYFNTLKEEAAKDNYTSEPELSCSLDDWYSKYESTARIEKGKIVLGKSEAQKKAELDEERKQQILKEIETLEMKGVRASRAIALNVQTSDDVKRLTEIENQISKLRKEFESLS